MKSFVFKLAKACLVTFIAIESVVLAILMRPIQDDYFNLQSVQQMGVLGYLTDTWNSHGGNMVQFLLHCLMILPTTQSFTFWNFSLFFLLTEALVFLSIRRSIRWFFPEDKLTSFWVPLLGIVSFEGLFVPGFLGAYGFSLASLAHLWPVLALLCGLLALPLFRGSWSIAFLLGLVAGNSNLGESAFACATLLGILVASKIISDFQARSGLTINSNFWGLSLGTFIGSVGIAVAPGFWERASDQVGLPSSLFDFLRRFAKSFASFTADALTHPLLWVILLLGVILSQKMAKFKGPDFHFKVRIMAVAALLIWMALIMGSTLAYPAWHQSMGMYLILTPLAFVLGVEMKLSFVVSKVVALLVIASLVSSIVLFRAGILGIHRSQVWDNNLQENICLIKKDSNADLLGAEIQYPPFKLGVEDINTWPWMRDKYVGWVENIPAKNHCD